MSISVVLLVNVRKEYYKEALASLKTQTDKDFELIIVSNIISVFPYYLINIIHPAEPPSIFQGTIQLFLKYQVLYYYSILFYLFYMYPLWILQTL